MTSLTTLGPEHAARFAAAEPFPHLVVDNLWPDSLLAAIDAEFPPADDRRWITYPDAQERGKKAGDRHMWGEATRGFFDAARSPDACAMLELLTGIEPLTADDIGGGMHETGDGGRLAMHVDFNVHPTLPLERRLNMLVFLSRDWDPAWGGTLYLGEQREVAVVPAWNRTVIFATGETSWHGHPEPVAGDHLRRSLACYYYAPLRAETAGAHSTVWADR
ncbi:2OG-Fe(II) oxygenase [Streptomyces sp. NBC_00124]|uniref:2OG-Fe(II) oxygenase n=1 Tax=Streptomyces sp. NBC_00124 TaxID=2975662 RepID=UPI00225422E2|nr:2OG-Fe(II) oxygenase [Streptomyces sp. NBC_00124]MCX5365960.1 2OG-Fe(II) oxygenase [Streptomyces sp. NBC_00124]